jgi:putative endonuclease
MPRLYFVFILSSFRRALYVGVTNDIRRRPAQHCSGQSTHSARYRTRDLVYFEAIDDATAAITREKQIKSWRREKKRRLIASMNPEWRDLSLGW